MAGKEYWLKRALRREAESYLRGAALSLKLFKEYERAAREIRKQINDFYARYASENGLSYEEAVKELNRKERQEWKGTIGDYVNRINNETDPEVKARLTAELDALSYSSQQSRLMAMEAQIQMTLNELYARGVAEMKAEFGETFKEAYYKKVYDIQQRVGFAREFAKVNTRMVEDVVSYPWSGSNFSERLWKNNQALIFNVREIITQGFIRGTGISEMSKQLSEKMGQSFKNAERLVRTETNYFHNEAEKRAYKAAGVKEYEFVATLDSRTSTICQELDGKHFKLEDAKVGENFPPMHPHCRSTTIEYDPEDALDWYNSGEPMPHNMTYEEWKEKYVGKDDVVDDPGDDQDPGSSTGPKTKSVPGGKQPKLVGAKPDPVPDVEPEPEPEPAPVFEPAKTREEAQKWVYEKMNIQADYSKYNIDVANAVNQEISKATELFGELTHLKSVGTFPKGYSTSWKGAYVESKKSLWLRNVSQKDSLEKLGAIAKQQHMIGFWSTPSEMHTIRHEIGHAVAATIRARNTPESIAAMKQIDDLRRKIQADVLKAKAGTNGYIPYLSKYGFTNTSEFIAECIAEYMNGSPRETARTVVNILRGII